MYARKINYILGLNSDEARHRLRF